MDWKQLFQHLKYKITYNDVKSHKYFLSFCRVIAKKKTKNSPLLSLLKGSISIAISLLDLLVLDKTIRDIASHVLFQST